MKKGVVIGIVVIVIILLGIGSYFLFFYDLEKDPSINTCLNIINERLLLEERIALIPKVSMKIEDYKKFETKEEALKFVEEKIRFADNRSLQELKDSNFDYPIFIVNISSTYVGIEKCPYSPEMCSNLQDILDNVYFFPVICVKDKLLDVSYENIKEFAGRNFEYDSETNERVFIINGEEKRFKVE